jgi:energy-coupling factor transport system substrate-specific component
MFTTPRLVLIALCAALNVAVGSIVYLLKLPIYLDSIGIILCALLLASDRWAGFVCASIAGTISCVIIFLLVNPFFIWFEMTVLAIALISVLLTARFTGLFQARPLPHGKFVTIVLLCGVVTGVVSAIVSAPVVAYLFGGVTGSGSAFVVAFFLKTGQKLLDAAVLSGLTADPIDKILQVLFAALLYRATPADFIAMLATPPTASAARAA